MHTFHRPNRLFAVVLTMLACLPFVAGCPNGGAEGPTAEFTATPLTGAGPLKVEFLDRSSPGKSAITSWSWDFGDGTTSSAANPAHTYYQSGVYSVSLTVTTRGGAHTTAVSDLITVYAKPSAEFSATPLTGSGPLEVTFTDQSAPGDEPILQWLWDFGDGSTSTDRNPVHTYQDAGDYTVSLTAGNDLGSTTKTKQGYIAVRNNPTAQFGASPLEGPFPLEVTFTDQSMQGSAPITFWRWDFGDGSTSTDARPVHVYRTPGRYNVSLTVTSTAGSDTLVRRNLVNVQAPPVAAFSADNLIAPTPLTVRFTDLSDPGTSPIISYSWVFGDGATSSSRNPTHTYTRAGAYTVSLTVVSEVGESTSTRPAYITAQAKPTADFVVDDPFGPLPWRVRFTDRSAPGTSPITSWLWDFGDGTTSTEANPAHVYTAAGRYDVSLTVTSEIGVDTKVQEELIEVVAERKVGIALDPSLQERMTSGQSIFPIGGRVLVLDNGPMPSLITWFVSNAGGNTYGQGSVASNGKWSGQVVLVPGENSVQFTIPQAVGDVTVNITYNQGYNVSGRLMVTPDVAFVGEAQEFTAMIALTDPLTNPESVMLYNVAGGVQVELARFTDDGDLLNGDEIEGDGIYTTRLLVTPPAETMLTLRARIGLAGGGFAWSEAVDVLFTERMTPAQYNSIATKQAAYQGALEALMANGDIDGVRSAVVGIVGQLQTDPDVAAAGATDSGLGVWIIYNAGVAGAIYAPETNVKRAAAPVVEGTPPPRYDGFVSGPPADFGFAKAASEFNTIRSNKAVGIAAEFWQWGEADDIPAMRTMLQNRSSFSVTYRAFEDLGIGSLEEYKSLGNYGMVLLSAHGDTGFKDAPASWAARFGWKDPFGQFTLHANVAVTPENRAGYEADLKTGRLVLLTSAGQLNYGVMPTFIRKYSGSFPNSLVYLSACRGAWSASIARAFLEKGAGVVLAYDDYVSVPFAEATGTSFLDRLLSSDGRVGGAFIPRQKDPVAVASRMRPAELRLLGDPDVSVIVVGLQDGGFESNNITQAWDIEGDARIIPRLGDAFPTEGQYMAIISTGLGFTTTIGNLSQEFVLPDTHTTLSFDWNFFSEEFLEFVGSVFQDAFVVTMTDVNNPANSVEFLHVTIDDLAEQVTPVEIGFDVGDVYATGWRNRTMVIPQQLRGRRVRLEFFCTDVGDGIYDTAVLIDDVKTYPPGDK